MGGYPQFFLVLYLNFGEHVIKNELFSFLPGLLLHCINHQYRERSMIAKCIKGKAGRNLGIYGKRP